MATGSARANHINVSIGLDPTALRAGIAAAQRTITASVGGIESQFVRVRNAADGAGRAAARSGQQARTASTGWSVLKRQLLAFTTVTVALHQALRFGAAIDSMTNLRSRLAQVTGSMENARKAQESLYNVSQNLQVSYEDLSKSFTTLLPLVQQMGGGVREAERLAETLAATARLSGATALEAASAQLQFAQAIGSGKLQGDELRSILENNQVLAKALADALGVNLGEIRKLGRENKLTSDVVANAILSQYDKIMARAAKLEYTMGGAWQTVANATIKASQSFDEATGFSRYLVVAFRALARVIEQTGEAFDEWAKQGSGQNAQSLKAFANAMYQVLARVADTTRVIWNQFIILAEAISTTMSALYLIGQDPFGRGPEIAMIAIKQGLDEIKGRAEATAEILKRVYSADGYRMPSDLTRTRPKAKGSSEASAAMTLDVGGFNIQATIESLKAEKALQLRRIDEAEAQAKLLADIQIRSQRELIQSQIDYQKERYDIIKTFDEKIAALEVEKAKDKSAEQAEQDRRATEAYIKNQTELQKLRDRMQQEEYRHSQSFWNQMQSGMQNLLQSMFQGTTDFKNLWRDVLVGVLDMFTSVLSQIISEWVIGFLRQKVTAVQSAFSQINAYAAVAAAAAYASIAAIPIYGPAVAPAAAASAYSQTIAWTGALSASAEGGYDIPFNESPATQLHPEEMVLPEKYANVIRGFAGEEGAGRNVAVNFNLSSPDAKGVVALLENEQPQLRRLVRKMLREEGVPMRGGRHV